MLTAGCFHLEERDGLRLLRLHSDDGVNRLTRACVVALTAQFHSLMQKPGPLIISGGLRFFSAGADIREIAALTGPEAREFAEMGRALMKAIECFPAPVYAAIRGYCMGGGLDLALACHRRIASPGAMFAHRGAALGLITGWGGTQRLPRLVGRAKALELFVAAEKMQAGDALRCGLVDAIVEDPVAEAARQIQMQKARLTAEPWFARRGIAVIP